MRKGLGAGRFRHGVVAELEPEGRVEDGSSSRWRSKRVVRSCPACAVERDLECGELREAAAAEPPSPTTCT